MINDLFSGLSVLQTISILLISAILTLICITKKSTDTTKITNLNDSHLNDDLHDTEAALDKPKNGSKIPIRKNQTNLSKIKNERSLDDNSSNRFNNEKISMRRNSNPFITPNTVSTSSLTINTTSNAPATNTPFNSLNRKKAFSIGGQGDPPKENPSITGNKTGKIEIITVDDDEENNPKPPSKVLTRNPASLNMNTQPANPSTRRSIASMTPTTIRNFRSGMVGIDGRINTASVDKDQFANNDASNGNNNNNKTNEIDNNKPNNEPLLKNISKAPPSPPGAKPILVKEKQQKSNLSSSKKTDQRDKNSYKLLNNESNNPFKRNKSKSVKFHSKVEVWARTPTFLLSEKSFASNQSFNHPNDEENDEDDDGEDNNEHPYSGNVKRLSFTMHPVPRILIPNSAVNGPIPVISPFPPPPTLPPPNSASIKIINGPNSYSARFNKKIVATSLPAANTFTDSSIPVVSSYSSQYKTGLNPRIPTFQQLRPSSSGLNPPFLYTVPPPPPTSQSAILVRNEAKSSPATANKHPNNKSILSA